MLFGMLMELYSHHLSRFQNILIAPKRNPMPISRHSLFLSDPSAPAPGNH